ncbi:MAG: Lrp/AsnC family transcriptional regulator [Pseudomonadota bacterium]
MKLDQTDSAILDLLREDGRMSNREVGRALGISEGTVRQRLRKLVDSQSMRLGLVTDIHTSGLAVGVTVRIKALPERIRAIAQALTELEASTFVGLTLGRFDIVAVLVARSRIEAADIIDNQIASIDGVREVDAQEPVSYTKHRYDLVYITE